MPEDRTAGRAPTSAERVAVVHALTEARQRGEISPGDQVERTDMAVRVTTLAELRALVDDLSDPPRLPDRGPAPSRRALLLGAGGVAVAGVVGVVALTGREDAPVAAPTVESTTQATAATPPPTAPPRPSPEPTPSTPPPLPDIDLYTVAGLEVLFAEYREKLGTWLAYGVTVTGRTQASADAVVLPVRKRRLQWWSWSLDERWLTHFDPHAVTSDRQQAIDLRKVDLAAVVANLTKARRVANVEEPGEPGIFFTHDPDHGGIVRIHVSNAYSEVGTLTTDLAGRELERRPFERS